MTLESIRKQTQPDWSNLNPIQKKAIKELNEEILRCESYGRVKVLIAFLGWSIAIVFVLAFIGMCLK